MMSMKVFLQLIFILCFWKIGLARKVQVTIFQGCGENIPVIFTVRRWSSEGNIFKFDSVINVTEDMRMNNLKLVLDIKKCRSAENPDTCERVYTFKSDKFCQIIKSEMWSSIYSSFTPLVQCPISNKGVYRSHNTSVDLSALLLFPSNRNYWKVRSLLVDKAKGDTWSCIEADAFY